MKRQLQVVVAAALMAGLALTGCTSSNSQAIPEEVNVDNSKFDEYSRFDVQAPVAIDRDKSLLWKSSLGSEVGAQKLKDVTTNKPDEELYQETPVQLYMDANLSMPIETVMEPTEGGFNIYPSPQVYAEQLDLKPSTNKTAPNPEDADPAGTKGLMQLFFGKQKWGPFPTFYMVALVDEDGNRLEKPQFTQINVTGSPDLSAPVLTTDDKGAIAHIKARAQLQEYTMMSVTSSLQPDGNGPIRTKFRYYPVPMAPKTAEDAEGWQLDVTNASYEYEGALRSAYDFLSADTNELTLEEAGLGDADITSTLEHNRTAIFYLGYNAGWENRGEGRFASGMLDVTSQLPTLPTNTSVHRDWKTVADMYPTVDLLAADGYVRAFPYTIEDIEASGKVWFKVRGTPIEDAYQCDQNDMNALKAMKEKVNEYVPKSDPTKSREIMANANVGQAPGGANITPVGNWFAESSVRPSADVFATTALSDFIAANLQAGFNSIDLSAFPEAAAEATVYDAFQEATNQNPLIMVHSSYPMYQYSTSTRRLNVRLPGATRDEYLSAQAQLEARAKEIVRAVVKRGMSEQEKATELSMWVSANVRYDDNFMYEMLNATAPVDDNYRRPANATGALLDGTAVCTGYARGYLLLAREAGLKAIVMYGDLGAAGHTWNKVQVDGHWVNFDPTFNSTNGNNNYMMLTDAQLIAASPRTFDYTMAVCAGTEGSFVN